MKEFCLSDAYKNRVMYSIGYETGYKGPNGEVEIQLVEEIFFTSAHIAANWFHNNYEPKFFRNPKVVKISGFNNLYVTSMI
jgi:hypothetical protein